MAVKALATAFDWGLCPVLEQNPDGVWILRNSKTPAYVVIDELAKGHKLDAIVKRLKIDQEEPQEFLEFIVGTLESPRWGPWAGQIPLDWSQCPELDRHDNCVSGAWVFRKTRFPASAVFGNLASGAHTSDVAEWFDITRERVERLLRFTARTLKPGA